MKVKIIDESHEKDLERSVNEFLESTLNEIIEIQFRTAVSIFGEEQVYCFFSNDSISREKELIFY